MKKMFELLRVNKNGREYDRKFYFGSPEAVEARVRELNDKEARATEEAAEQSRKWYQNKVRKMTLALEFARALNVDQKEFLGDYLNVEDMAQHLEWVRKDLENPDFIDSTPEYSWKVTPVEMEIEEV